jgi:hypothetical protein
MRATLAAWSWRATIGGVVLIAAGAVAILVASIQGMALQPDMGLIDGYWVGLLPWMGVGTWLVPIGSLLAVAGGCVLLFASRPPLLVRLVAIVPLAVALFWGFVTAAVDMAPHSRPGTTTTSSDLATAFYSNPASSLLFLTVPAFVVVGLAIVTRRRTA